MASQIDIYNLALGFIGVSETVDSLEERSKNRLACGRFWELARDTVLAQFPWPFATKYATLAALPQTTRPYLFTYQYPTDCLKAMFFTNAIGTQPDEKYQARFETSYGDGGQVILSSEAAPVLAYVVRVEDVGRFPPLFVEALAYKLASMIAMPISNTRAIAETNAQLYTQAVQEAWASALNESNFATTRESEYITVRGGGSSEYCYPWIPGGRN